MPVSQNDLELYQKLKKSPIFFVEFMWGLVPERDNSKFVKGKHITWQQHDLLLAVERSLQNEGSKRITVRSGHGTGKTAALAWLVLWYLFTHKDSQIPCTAPTSDQMYDVLWKEIAAWIKRMPSEAQVKYEWSTTYVRILESPETWFARAKTARKEAPEALAGIHGEFVMFIIDEASGVADEIFTTAEGALTNANILVIMMSNPTRLIGYFYESHHKDKASWQALHFNSELSPIVDAKYVERIATKFGKESDEFRVRVLGEFPKEDAVDSKGYVPLLVDTDLRKTPDSPFVAAKRLGVDPSGEGDDETLWVVRDQFKAKITAREKVSNPKSIAQKTLTLMHEMGIEDVDVTVDNFGEGANVAQELALAGKRVNAINVGESADDTERFLNKRAEAYWRMREWLRKGGELVESDGWSELLTLRYRAELSGKLKMMSKEDMRKEGIRSPNVADALMLTFVKKETTGEEVNDPYVEENGTAFISSYD